MQNLYLTFSNNKLEKIFWRRWTLTTNLKEFLPEQGRHFGRRTVTMTTEKQQHHSTAEEDVSCVLCYTDLKLWKKITGYVKLICRRNCFSTAMFIRGEGVMTQRIDTSYLRPDNVTNEHWSDHHGIWLNKAPYDYLKTVLLYIHKVIHPVTAATSLAQNNAKSYKRELVPERMNHADVYCSCRPLSWCETSRGWERKKRGAGALSVTTTTLEQIGNNIIQKVEIFSDISANGLLDLRHISKLDYIEEIIIQCC